MDLCGNNSLLSLNTLIPFCSYHSYFQYKDRIFIGDDGTDLDTYGATITAVVNGTPSTNNMPADLEFATNSGTSTATVNMKITKDGVIEGTSNAEIKTSPIRKHSNTISTNTTIATTENAIAGGPINVATGVTLTINGNFTVV